jgi:hypothetical protein
VVSGACTVSNGATCFRSPNFPSNYDVNQQCIITTSQAVTLSVTAFDLEADPFCGYDSLMVNGVAYCGTAGPEGILVTPDGSITFTSDNIWVRSGFEICGGAFLTTRQP